jgi:hypothetical protein
MYFMPLSSLNNTTGSYVAVENKVFQERRTCLTYIKLNCVWKSENIISADFMFDGFHEVNTEIWFEL